MSPSRRRKRNDVGMDLFPFMAVLICTMGSLIMLLVVMVQQARVRAQDSPAVVATNPTAEREARIAVQMALRYADEQNDQVNKALAAQQQQLADHEQEKKLAAKKQQEIEDLRWRAEVLRPTYEQTVEDLSAQRLALSHLEQHTRELSDQASKMQAEANMIAEVAAQGTSVLTATREDLNRINDQLASAKLELASEQDKLHSQNPKYALVPYDGPSGTHRPPIYIECLADRVILQPENVVLIGEDFKEPLTNSNPLALALRAKREFMLKQGLLPEGAEPYPLLVVRPGAASSYAAARSAMKAWEAEFGYELVEADIDLDYQVPDPRLSTLLEDLVIDARGRRRMIRTARQSQRVQREMLRPSASGGFETVPNGSSSYAGESRSRNSHSNNDDKDPFGQGGMGDSAVENSGFGMGGEPDSLERAGAPYQDDSRRTSNRFEQAGINSAATGSTQGVGFEQYSTSTHGPNGTQTTQAGDGADSRSEIQGAATGTGGTSSTASGSGGQGTSGAGGASQQSGSTGSQLTINDSAQYQSLAQTRGKDWALPGANANAVGIKRPIRIICDKQKLTLVPEKGSRDELQIFRDGGSVPAVIDPFVTAVQSRVASWGIAGQGIFWRPVLQIHIRGDADGKYRQLLQLLDSSGIEVTREP